jgi:hypothetical protein
MSRNVLYRVSPSLQCDGRAGRMSVADDVVVFGRSDGDGFLSERVEEPSMWDGRLTIRLVPARRCCARWLRSACSAANRGRGFKTYGSNAMFGS